MREIEYMARRWAAPLAGALLVVLLAGAANATKYFTVTTEQSNLTYQTGNSVLPVLGNLPTSYGGTPALRWRPQGSPIITGTGSDPVSLTIPPGLVNFAPPYPAVLPVPSIPTYIQFTTGLAAYAPHASSANFFPGTKTSRPANFSWCPGASANPACTTVLAGGSQGSISGIVKYQSGLAGPQYGGTMKILNTGPFQWYTVEATLPTYKVRLNGEDAGSAPNTLIGGGAYSNYDIETAGAGDKIFNSPPKVPTYYGAYSIITDPGPVASIAPGQSSRGWGFPFTTGTVYIKVPFYPSPFLTITGMGADNRTPAGAGNISMVAGGLLNSPQTGFTIPQLITFTINVPEAEEVSMLAAGVGLLGLIGLVRRRASA